MLQCGALWLMPLVNLPCCIPTTGFPEAATLSNDKQRLYYHQKNEAGVYAVYMRYREPATYAEESGNNISWALYPNPAKDVLQVALP